MPDLTQDIEFRNFLLNDAQIRANIIAGGGAMAGIAGCVVDSADFSDVDVSQFTEKRSESDGVDVGPVFMGGRRLRLAGTLYDVSPGLTYDRLRSLREALSPTLAMRELPEEKGYRPLYYSEETNRLGQYPEGTIEFMALAMPRQLSWVEQRDQLGDGPYTENVAALAIPFQATFLMKDPSLKARNPQIVTFEDGGVFAGDLINRGNYHVPWNMLIHCTGVGGTVNVSIGGATFTLTIPATTGGDPPPDQIIRIDGLEKTVHREVNGINALAMNIINFPGAVTWPLVGGDGFLEVPYTIDFGALVLVDDDTIFYYWEAYA